MKNGPIGGKMDLQDGDSNPNDTTDANGYVEIDDQNRRKNGTHFPYRERQFLLR